MISKKKPPEQIGKSNDLPEGIYGDTRTTKKARTSGSSAASKKAPRIKTIERRNVVIDRRWFGFNPKNEVHLELKRKRKLKRKLRLQQHHQQQKPHAVIKNAPSIIPGFDINYGATLPAEAEGLPIQNVVGMRESDLKTIIANTESFTAQLSKLMLTQVTPGVLAFDAASSYVQAVLKAGLKIDTEVDTGVVEAVQMLSRLEVINMYIDRMTVRGRVKRLLRERFVDGLTSTALEKMKKISKGEEMSQAIRELDAVLLKRSEAKPGEKNARSARKPKQPDFDEIGQVRQRRDTPAAGGF